MSKTTSPANYATGMEDGAKLSLTLVSVLTCRVTLYMTTISKWREAGWQGIGRE